MTTLPLETDAAAFNDRINTMAAFVQARCDEDEMWAVEASRDDDNPVPDGGVHWQWVASEDDDIVTPDPATTDHVGDDSGGYGRDVSLRSVEEWPVRSSPGRTLPQFAIHTAEEVLPAVGGHIIRHDPSRVLREIKAKRSRATTLLTCAAKAEQVRANPDRYGDGNRGEILGMLMAYMHAVSADAEIWAAHPAYDPSWRVGP